MKTRDNLNSFVNDCSFVLIFFKAASHTNPNAVKNEQDWVHIFQETYFENSQIHKLTVTVSYDLTLNVLLWNL